MKSLTLESPLRLRPSGKVDTIRTSVTLTANAGTTAITSIAIPANTIAIVRAKFRAAAGAVGPISVVADATADTLTLIAHGILTGTPVFVVGGTQPGGVTATTVYYARAASSSTITLYDTQAHANSGGGTGLVDITSAGATVVLSPTLLTAVYIVDAALTNKQSVTALVGSINKVAFENVAAWDVDIAADDSNDALVLKGTPDAVLDTRFEVEADVEFTALDVGV